ncbi:MAG: hypothetical protein JJU45_13650, partial [Acidimicrobiia bacterium]|nr:hypothetical protein [Acidimicrobiia bacterium]
MLATGLVVGSAVSADEPPTTDTITTETVTTETITTDSATTVTTDTGTSEESVETKSGNSSTSSSSTSTTTTAPPPTTTIPALSDVAPAGSTSGRSMSVESPGQVLVPAELSGPSLQLTEPPEAPTTTTLPPL